MINYSVLLVLTALLFIVILTPARWFKKSVNIKEYLDSNIMKEQNTIENQAVSTLVMIGAKANSILRVKVPPKLRNYYKVRLELAGLSKQISLEGYLSLKLGLMIVIFMFLTLLYITDLSVFSIAIILSMSIMTYFVPDNIVNQKVAKREKEISRDIPMFLNSVSILTDAGLTVLQSIEEVSNRKDSILYKTFKEASDKVRFGYSFIESFEVILKGVESYELRTFVSYIVQSHEKGNEGLSSQIKVLAEDSYQTRKLQVQKLANEASSKLFIPLLFLVLPAVLVVIVGPIIFSVLEVFNG